MSQLHGVTHLILYTFVVWQSTHPPHTEPWGSKSKDGGRQTRNLRQIFSSAAAHFVSTASRDKRAARARFAAAASAALALAAPFDAEASSIGPISLCRAPCRAMTTFQLLVKYTTRSAPSPSFIVPPPCAAAGSPAIAAGSMPISSRAFLENGAGPSPLGVHFMSSARELHSAQHRRSATTSRPLMCELSAGCARSGLWGRETRNLDQQ